jgi:hypothetical protein
MFETFFIFTLMPDSNVQIAFVVLCGNMGLDCCLNYLPVTAWNCPESDNTFESETQSQQI